jgi:SAM-dependent methyltransferase
MSDDKKDTRELHRAYQSGSPQETAEIYDSWSADYESHMKNVGYAHPAIVAALLARHQPPGDHPILDAGAGTGILGEILTALGYANLSALDASEGMLAQAKAKANYRDLKHLFLGQDLDYPDDHFAAVASAGVFTKGHAPLSGLEELTRITRSGGFLVFSVALTYLEGPFDELREHYVAGGAWRFLEASKRYNSAPLGDNLLSQAFAFQVLPAP